MEDLDFDQLFADKMRQAGAPDISEVDWKPLSARLDAFDRKRHRMMPLWWLGALTGILFLSNLIWWSLWYNNNQQTSHIQAEWQNFQQQTLLVRDTVVQKTIVYIYDTIWITTRPTDIYSTGYSHQYGLGQVPGGRAYATLNRQDALQNTPGSFNGGSPSPSSYTYPFSFTRP